MINKRLLVLMTFALAILVSMPADAWRHRMRSTVEAEKKAERHRRDLEHSFAVPTPNEGSTWLCAAYSRNFEHSLRNKGNNLVEFEINRFGGSFDNEPETETLSVRATIKDNRMVACAKTNKPLDRNDVILSRHVFNKAPRMKSDEETPRFRVWTSMSNVKLDADDFFPPPPPPPAPDEGTGGGGGGNDGGSGDSGDGGGGGDTGGGSAASNQQAAQLLRGCATSSIGVQFQWDKGRQYVDRRAGGVVTTIGPFGSFAEAANAARSRWGCSGGLSTSSDDGNQMPRLNNWGSVSGRRLALRFEKTGGSQVHVDAYAPGLGAIHGSAFGSVGAAIRNFCGISSISC